MASLLRDVLTAIPEPMPLNVELKRRHAPSGIFARRVLAELDGRKQVLVSSFDRGLLEEIRKTAPDLPLAPIERHQPRELLEAGRALGAFSLHCHRRLVTGHITMVFNLYPHGWQPATIADFELFAQPVTHSHPPKTQLPFTA